MSRQAELEEGLRRIEDELVDVFPSPRADILIDDWTRKAEEVEVAEGELI